MECVNVLRGRSGTRMRPAATTIVCVGLTLLVAGCGGGGRVEQSVRLVDGSTAPPLPAALARLESGAVATRAGAIRADELDTRGRACLDSFRSEFRVPPETVVVQRVALIGASLTFLDAEHRVVLGCDRTSRRDAHRLWCARSVGRLFSGRLRDPRVDILCRDSGGDRVGFGWVDPASGVRWIVARNGSRAEVEGVIAGLPVRIATTEVDAETSSATFDVRELAGDGKVVRRYRLRAAVAG